MNSIIYRNTGTALLHRVAWKQQQLLPDWRRVSRCNRCIDGPSNVSSGMQTWPCMLPYAKQPSMVAKCSEPGGLPQRFAVRRWRLHVHIERSSASLLACL